MPWAKGNLRDEEFCSKFSDVLALGKATRQLFRIFLFPATCPVLFTELGGESGQR
jgi:hypothetical protein